MADQNKSMIYLSLGMLYPLILFVVFFAISSEGATMPFSIQAMIAPYFGSDSLLPIVLGAVCMADILLFHTVLFPSMISDEKGHLALLSFPGFFAIFGLIIGILSRNPWASLPYLLIGAGHYIYAYQKITAQKE